MGNCHVTTALDSPRNDLRAGLLGPYQKYEALTSRTALASSNRTKKNRVTRSVNRKYGRQASTANLEA